MNISIFPEVEPSLNKYEKIIFEYLLDSLEISSTRSVKLSINSFENDLDMIPNLLERIFELNCKKIVFREKDTGLITLCFNIIDGFSIIDNEIIIIFSEQLYDLFINKETVFHIYSLLFQNKYTLNLFKIFSKNYPNFSTTLEQLKKNIKLDDAYSRLYDFEKKILKNSIEEINSYTNLKVSYSKKYSKIKEEPMKLVFQIEKGSNKRAEYHENFKKSYNELIDKFRSIYNF